MRNKFVFAFDSGDTPLGCEDVIIFNNMSDARDYFDSKGFRLNGVDGRHEEEFYVKTGTGISFYGKILTAKEF